MKNSKNSSIISKNVFNNIDDFQIYDLPTLKHTNSQKVDMHLDVKIQSETGFDVLALRHSMKKNKINTNMNPF